jgi:hypothetical protein
MIPATLMLKAATQLAARTRRREVRWNPAPFSGESYSAKLGNAQLQLSFFPARTGEDGILFDVSDQFGNKVGTLAVKENERELYEPLAELLFAIQRVGAPDPFRQVTDDLLNLLTDSDKARWGGAA